MEETSMQKTEKTDRQDLYTRITAQIEESLEKGVRPWVKPWNAEHACFRAAFIFRCSSRSIH
jgi:antirestriction protein ArdC